MSSPLICMLIAIAVYLIGMLAIGAYYSKDQKTSGDFYLGGRKLGPVVTAMSTEASDMSGWLLMGLPGLAYFTGICDLRSDRRYCRADRHHLLRSLYRFRFCRMRKVVYEPV